MNKNFALYVLGRFISILGSGMQNVAVILYLIDTSGKGSIIGLLGIAITIPRLIMLPFSGVIGDTFNRKWIMIITDVGSGISIFILLILSFGQQTFNIYWVIALESILSVFSILFRSSTRAMVVELVSETDLQKANSVLKFFENSSGVISPLIGAVLYSLFGLKVVYLINACSYLLSGISEMWIKYHPKIVNQTKLSIKKTMVMFKEGFSYIINQKQIKQISLFYFLSSTLVLPFMSVILPFLLKNTIRFSNQQFSIIESSFVIGMIIGSLLLGTLLSKIKAKSLIKLGLIVNIIVFLCLSIIIYPFFMQVLQQTKWLYLMIFMLLLGSLGLSDIIYDTPVETYLQLLIPKHLLSRVLSTTQLLFGLGIPLGQALFGILLDYMPVYLLVTFVSILYIGIIVFFLIYVNPHLKLKKTKETKLT